MGDNGHVDEIVNSLDSVSKVFVILHTIKESKFKYISILEPKDGEPIMKVKLNLDNDSMVDFLDTFFDAGFIIKQITKNEFDTLETNDIVKYNIE